MTAISMKLPDALIDQSTHIANELGISRSALIRQALTHEIERITREREQKALTADLKNLAADPDYLAESALLDASFNDIPADDAEQWWEDPRH